MKIQFEDREFDLDLDEIDVAQAKVIKIHRGLTLKGLSDGLNELDADALAAAYWLMCVQSGLTGVNIDQVNFKIIRFAEAIAKAAEAAEAASVEDTPKE